MNTCTLKKDHGDVVFGLHVKETIC